MDTTPESSKAEMEEYDNNRSPASPWNRIAGSPGFRSLLAGKKRFIIPAFLIFLVYYFTLPVLVGYAPQAMSKKIFGVLSIAYAFAFSQFAMGWVLAWLYVRAAAKFDRHARQIIETANDAGPQSDSKRI